MGFCQRFLSDSIPSSDRLMAKSGETGVRRIISAAAYSAKGFRAAWKHEASFRQELVLAVLLTPAAIWLGRSIVEQAMLIGVCLLVLIVELLNSAIETAIDRIGSEQHELSGRAKDIGSAAVFVSLVLVVVVWAAIAWERFS
jgi:diacylglycerol kinase (ATP)